MSLPKIARLSVTAGDYSVASMTVTIAINEVPIAALTVAKKSGNRVRRPLSAEVVATIRERQQKRLAGLVAPDITIQADDGRGGQLDFVGYMIAPVVEIGTTSTVDSFTVLGVDGMLDALDLSYYKAGYQPKRGEKSTYGDTINLVLDPIPGALEGKVTQLISTISQVLIGNFQPSVDGESHPTVKELITQQHNVNSGLPISLWLRILANSNVVYESWAEAYKTTPAMGNTTSWRIVQMLQQKVGGFWSMVNGLMSTFQMYYIPDTTASGRFERADKKVDEPTSTLDLSASGISVSDGNHKLLTIGGVVIMRPVTPGARPESSYAPGTQSIAGQYPKQLLTGYIQREMPPSWLGDAHGGPIAGVDLDRPAASKKLNLSIPDYIKRREGVEETAVKADDAAASILDEVCEVMFKELQLAHSTAIATVPLDYKIKVGERVTVNVLSGGSFTAFVNRVVHRVDLQNGKELNSFTQVSFTHVKY